MSGATPKTTAAVLVFRGSPADDRLPIAERIEAGLKLAGGGVVDDTGEAHVVVDGDGGFGVLSRTIKAAASRADTLLIHDAALTTAALASRGVSFGSVIDTAAFLRSNGLGDGLVDGAAWLGLPSPGPLPTAVEVTNTRQRRRLREQLEAGARVVAALGQAA